MNKIDKINMFSCDHCEYWFASNINMDIHNRTFHDKKVKYYCDICGHQVSLKMSFARHKTDMEKGVDTRTLSAEIFENCGNF